MSHRASLALALGLAVSPLACGSEQVGDDEVGQEREETGTGDESGDTGGTGETGETGETGGTGETDETGGDLTALELPPGHEVNTGRVASSQVCSNCHANSDSSVAMRDEADRPVAPHDLWRSSMMANAGRDPFWHAMVEAEVLATPSAAEAIEAKCTRCHTPLLSAERELQDAAPPALADLYEPDSDDAALGLDGVSCTLCHQIEDEQLGQPASFSGGWSVAGEGRIYGPHADPFAMPMINQIDMTPELGDHLLDSATCATCHTLHTDALTPEGAATGSTLAEQAPYLEWRNSIFSTEVAQPAPQAASCQDCHAPKRSEGGVDIATKIARRPDGGDFPFNLPERSPYGRHTFVGANAAMLTLIRDNAETLKPEAPAAAFDQTIAATRAQLQEATAAVEIESLSREGDELRVRLSLTNLAGHKLPTAFPSRRVFAQIELRDGEGQLVFASGTFDAHGRLLDGEGEVLASELAGGPVATHLDQISSPDQVQIWEAVMADDEGQPTYRLLRGASYYKDDRLLPAGWDPLLAEPGIAPVGVDGDPDFAAGGDHFEVLALAPAGAGPYGLEVRVYYQTLSPRFLAELFALDGPRIRAFETMVEAAELQPELLASVETTIE